MFFAPYGCSWAKHSICKSLLVQSQIPGLVHTHPSIFGGKLFISSLHVGDVKLRETYPNKFLRNQAEGKPVSKIIWVQKAKGNEAQ